MSPLAWLQAFLFLTMVLALSRPLGSYIARVLSGERTLLSRPLGWLEQGTYRLMGVDPGESMSWTTYAKSLLGFSLLSLLFTYGALRLQGLLPHNPQGFGSAQMPPDLAANTAISFSTNTNWQAYSPELTVSNGSNMVALAIHNWASAAVGIAVAIAVIRGFAHTTSGKLGNFWADVVRSTLYILLPIAFFGAIGFVAMGVPQTFAGSALATTLEGASQKIALGPIASQEAIKHLGTNGGGFFNANSAHPFENPSPGSNLLSLVLMWSIPAALTHTFGIVVGNTKQGLSILVAMTVLAVAGIALSMLSEQAGTPHLSATGVNLVGSSIEPGGNMEGKEVRFGIAGSALFATVTTGASCGAVNAMHGSFTPLGTLVPLFNMVSGEVIFGGVGAGLYGMLVFAVLAVFIAGLMVGRTPEYLGKKIEKFEVQLAMVTMLVLALCILGLAAISSVVEFPKEGAWSAINAWPGSAYGGTDTRLGPATGNLANAGPRGFSEILYAYASAGGNNGSAMAGITANTPWYNGTLGVAMLVGRFMVIVPMLALAGSLSRKPRVPDSAGTLPTDTLTFAALLVGIVVIVGALTYFPALSLGPIVEHLKMHWASLY